METLLQLADRVEKLTGPDREVDGYIHAHLNPETQVIVGQKSGRFPQDPIYGTMLQVMDGVGGKDGADYIGAPAYSASLDAAMSLVPEGWAIDRLSMWPASPEGADNQTASHSSCEMVGTSVERMGRKQIWGYGGRDGRANATAATPALALTAAALRARAGGEG